MGGSAKRIENQKEMQQARAATSFCYICGAMLPKRGPGYKRQVIGEHVIPQALLGNSPAHSADRWAVELDVHPGCEQDDKRLTDNLLSLLQQMSTKPGQDWPAFGQLRSDLRLRPIKLVVEGEDVPAFSNVGHVLAGCWTWIRGLHAALYNEPLPEEAPHLDLPPVPAFYIKIPVSLGDVEGISVIVRQVVDMGTRKGKWDGVDAWGKQVTYRCVWHHKQPGHKISGWVCFWTLSFPGTEDWSKSVLGEGSERPWHGFYAPEKLPDGASFLASEDFPIAEEDN